MSTATRYIRFRVRGRTAAEWASLNEVLLERELGLETDTRKFKFGTGTDPWADLPYAGGADLAQTIVEGDTAHAPSGAAVFAELTALTAAVFAAFTTRVSGNYTPVCTGAINVTSCNGNRCNWSRSNEGFVVSGSVQVKPTAANTSTSLQVSLPFVTAFTDNLDCSGPVTGKAAGVPNYEIGQVLASAGTGDLSITFYPATTNNYTLRFCVVVPIQ